MNSLPAEVLAVPVRETLIKQGFPSATGVVHECITIFTA